MKDTIHILLIILIAFGSTARVQAQTDATTKEYQVKTAFIYNFFNFVEWPREKIDETNTSDDTPIIVGYVTAEGCDDYIEAIETLNSKKIKNKSVVVKVFDDLRPLFNADDSNTEVRERLIESLKKCHILIFCKSERDPANQFSAVLESVKGSGVLTVGENSDFLETGGIVNFVIEDNKVRFEINLDAARENRLSIRAKLLKLAKRVIQKSDAKQ